MPEPARTQANRTMAIGTPLGEDKLLLLAMHGAESLGRLFEFQLDLATEGAPIDYTKILGQNVTVRLSLRDGGTRYFNGYISKFTFVALDESQKDHRKVFQYRATMVPWTWFMTRTADCRIFQEMKVPEIIEKIFREKGFTDFSNELNATYRKWEYCVQYRETDFNFISRLMENEGIYYYFKHANGKHTLVMCDAPSNHSPASGYKDLHFDEPDIRSTHDAYIWDWVLGHEITANQYAIDDYDPLQPRSELFKSLNIEHTHDPGTYEMFDYPGGYVTGDEGKAYVHVRLEELEAQYAIGHGFSSARGLHAGATFTLQDHPAFDPEEYLVTSVAYQLQNDDMGLGAGRSTGRGAFQSQVTCIPAGYEFRAPRTTPKPVVQGPQTAMVVGPSGEEIYTDKYGRVKVFFHWDRESKGDEKSSCWVRVSQEYAGKKWGSVTIPRIGQEVIVDFLEGDPDRPIITGRVYNGDNMPPYDLPTSKMISGLKSNTTPKGGGYNEFSMDDTKGTEKITVHGQYDMNTTIEHDQTDVIHNNRTTTVDVDDTETVTGKQTISVTGDQDITLKANQTQAITGNQTESIKGNQDLSVQGNQSEKITGNQSFDVTGTNKITVNGTMDHTSKGAASFVSNASIKIEAPQIEISAKASIKISVGGSSIQIDPSGIKVTAPGMVAITAATIKNNG